MFFDPNQPTANQPGLPQDQNQDQNQDQLKEQIPPQPGDNPPQEQPADSIDAYTPPANTPQAAHTPWSDDWQAQPSTESTQTTQSPEPVVSPTDYPQAESSDQAQMDVQPELQSEPQAEPQSQSQSQPSADSQPEPAAPSGPVASPSAGVDSQGSDSQAIEDQNIFHLLGLEDGKDEEKEAFLDELQQVIWEDFIESDAPMLLTEAENQELSQIVGNQELGDLDRQEQALTFLESKVPDLEEILLEKALELKQEMVLERIAGLKEFHANNSESLDKISQAEAKIQAGLWKDGADILNQLP